MASPARRVHRDPGPVRGRRLLGRARRRTPAGHRRPRDRARLHDPRPAPDRRRRRAARRAQPRARHARADRGANDGRPPAAPARRGRPWTRTDSSLSPSGRLEPRPPGRAFASSTCAPPGRYELFCNMAGHYLGGMSRGVRGRVGMRRRTAFHPFAGPRPPRRRRDPGRRSRFLGDRASGSRSGRPRDRSTARAVLEVAARQRTLAERYVKEVLLVRARRRRRPGDDGACFGRARDALLDGGTRRPSTATTTRPRSRRRRPTPVARPARAGAAARRRPDGDRRALLARPAAVGRAARPPTSTSRTTDPVVRLRVLAALTSNVSLNAARTIAAGDRPEHRRADRRSRSLLGRRRLLRLAPPRRSR